MIKQTLISLALILTPALSMPSQAGCCSQGAGEYSLPSFSSSKKYESKYISVYNKGKSSVYVEGSSGKEHGLAYGEGIMLPIEVASDGTIKYLGIDSKYSGWKDVLVRSKPSNSDVLYIYHIAGKIKVRWKK